MSQVKPIAVQLTRGQDLKSAISSIVKTEQIQAGSIASCIGSLSTACLRLAGASEYLRLSEPLEIVSVMGTLTPEHQHIHISVSKQSGEVVGGHLMEGACIDTTAELILHSYERLTFSREYDRNTGFSELVVADRD
ncbi:hypothetical protein VINI7043_09240 [Vibrio nigripulchritudo ATCC 27043]|uniref:PPC domain-containing DNA-binding protein n=1 Tax=Vibrio nigripulchritudo TaxID=28173 RepID=UPI00021C29DF|nr:PPC domain-containing DNA-binding protein [Vibrio nigripulchritudo]EGU60363.1 hypothetical protein VINI7043_09240 [Vibrio nigripulchritudo ATCC 27043]